MRKIAVLLLCIIVLLPVSGCSKNESSDDTTISSETALDSETTVESSSVPDGWIYESDYKSYLTNPPEEWSCDWTVTVDNDVFNIQARPLYAKVWADDRRYIQALVVLKITNISGHSLEWRCVYMGTDLEALYSRSGDHGEVVEPDECIIRCLPVGARDQSFNRVVVEIEPFSIASSARYGKIIRVTTEFSDLEIPDVSQI